MKGTSVLFFLFPTSGRHIWNTMRRPRDSLGRRYRHYRKRVDPLRIFSKTEFQARYRLSKKLVFQLSRKFKPHNSTKGKKMVGVSPLLKG